MNHIFRRQLFLELGNFSVGPEITQSVGPFTAASDKSFAATCVHRLRSIEQTTSRHEEALASNVARAINRSHLRGRRRLPSTPQHIRRRYAQS